ncbi:hypothetical protein RRG08_014368 [Elysia crispata]|uniref:Uncharacterized protein n=1 Tax=Elysia crispata TaxID=231223 RepID=A0AAE0YPB1_9GAST|nr:hypothetical protein RRG08_014368 [Elysia crispata]
MLSKSEGRSQASNLMVCRTGPILTSRGHYRRHSVDKVSFCTEINLLLVEVARSRRTPASEPSLLSGINQSSGSKQAVLSHSLVSSSEAKETESVRLRRLTNREENNKENSEPLEKITPRSSRSDPPSPVDPSHKPSYLKLSCAVSGYGKYSRYSTYKDVNRRSPFSSQSSLRSEVSSPEPGSMPAERKSGEDGTPEHNHTNHTPNHLSPSYRGGAGSPQAVTNNHKPAVSPPTAVNGHSVHLKYPTGDIVKDGEYFLQHTQFEEDRIRGLCLRAEAHMRAHDLPEEACGLIRSAIGKANLLLTQKFVQFRELCQNHMVPDPDEPETLWGDLQGFWDMVKIQIDNVDDLFAEIELMRHNGWQEIPKQMSRRSSASSSPKSGTISQASTPSATPGSKRKNTKPPGSGGSSKNTPDSSPERTQKARQAAKARDEARRKLLAERRAAMKQQLQQQQQAGGDAASVEIFVPDKK